jgi:DNA polymerase phi
VSCTVVLRVTFTESPLPSSLVNILKVAANSVKKEHKLPNVALDLLRLALKESRFELFWKKVLEEGLLKNPSWTSRCV